MPKRTLESHRKRFIEAPLEEGSHFPWGWVSSASVDIGLVNHLTGQGSTLKESNTSHSDIERVTQHVKVTRISG